MMTGSFRLAAPAAAALLALVPASAPLAGQAVPGQAGAATPAPRLGIDTTNFDRSVRPQDDFYRYVNGAWLERTEIPADRSNYGSFTELAEEAEESLRRIIEELASADALEPASDEARIAALYRSFMNRERVERLGLEPLRPDLERARSLDRLDDLVALFAYMTETSVGRPFSAHVGVDAKQSDRYTVYLSQSGLGLPDRDYYFEDGWEFARTRGAYVDYMRELLARAGHEDPGTAANRIMALETRIADAHWSRVQNRNRDLTYNRRTIQELERLAPAFDWAGYLDAIGAVDIEAVVVRQPSYFAALDTILRTTPIDSWRDYATFRLLDDAAPLLSSEFADAHFDFHGRVLSGSQEQRADWKRGLGVVRSAMGDALGRLYVERHFSPEARERMQELVANLKEAFRRGIDELEWMSPATRAQAHEKLSSFNTKIGYPDEWKDFSGLVAREDDLLGNMRRASVLEHRRDIDKLGGPIDRNEWGMFPYTVNAYYSSTLNEIVFPAGILQPPFFDPLADEAVNYGAIGAVIGHEISHGFDDQGRKSDGDGNLRDWWTEADAAAFEARAARLAAQYNEFNPIDDLHVNGELTLGENIGDLSGLAVAHDAYRLSLDGAEAPVIAGLTGDQRFFMGWAQIWRRLYRDEELRNRLLTDPHSPSRYRVNGVVRNMDAFARAFGVQPGDQLWLPPEQRVEIW